MARSPRWGYCFGGRTVLELARSGADLTGVISVHGSLETATPAGPGEVKASSSSVTVLWTRTFRPTKVTEFIEEMNAAGADYQLIVYGGATHGFTHDVGAQSPGAAYHAASDRRSSQAIKTFLAETPRNGGGGDGRVSLADGTRVNVIG